MSRQDQLVNIINYPGSSMMNLQVRKGLSMLLEFCHCGTFKKNRQNLGWAHSLRLEFYTWFNMEKNIIVVFNGEHSPQQSIP